MLTSFMYGLTSGHISNQDPAASPASCPPAPGQLLAWESLLILIFTNAVIV